MVPFSFENITRSASLEAPSVFPLSDAARATHESFESHLQRAAASGRDQATRRSTREEEPRKQPESTSNDPPRNERSETANETHRDDADNRQREAPNAPSTTEARAEHDADDAQPDSATGDEVVVAVAVDEPRASIQEVVLDVPGDAGDTVDKADAAKLAGDTLGGEESEASRVANAEAAVESNRQKASDESAAGRKLNRGNGDLPASTDSDASVGEVNSSNTTEVADGRRNAEAQASETFRHEAERSKTSTTVQRRGSRSDIAASQATRETTDPVAEAIATDVVQAAHDAASEDTSRQLHNRKDADVSQPIGTATSTESNTSTAGTPSRFAQHLLGRTDNSAARSLSITDADQARFVDRVARALQATGERGGTLRLRLSPPELGALTLEVKVQSGVISARIEADTPAARSLLIDNLPVLRERLAEHGMRVDQFDVDLSDRHAGGTPDGLQQNDQQQQDRPRAKAPVHEPDDTSSTSPGTALTKIGNEQLNIIV